MIISENTKEKITDARGAVKIFEALFDARQETEKHKEYMYVLYLDSQNRVICVDLASFGTVNQCNPHVREILRMALIKNAVSFIVCHNHPSGNITPSREDEIFTKKLNKSGLDIGIKFLDHIIIGEGYHSFSESGVI